MTAPSCCYCGDAKGPLDPLRVKNARPGEVRCVDCTACDLRAELRDLRSIVEDVAVSVDSLGPRGERLAKHLRGGIPPTDPAWRHVDALRTELRDVTADLHEAKDALEIDRADNLAYRIRAARESAEYRARQCNEALDELIKAKAKLRDVTAERDALRRDRDALMLSYTEACGGLARRGPDFADLFDDRVTWSRETFGDGERTASLTAHIRKELAEIEAAPADLEEWVDVCILAMDGAWRAAGADGAAFLAALVAKDAKNRARKWPAQHEMKPGEPTEHVREAPPPCTGHLRTT